MKKLFLFVLSILLITTIMAQEKATVIMSEDFSSGNLPDGWSADTHSNNWVIYNGNDAQGTAPELMFYWNPQFNGDTKLITSVYDLSAYSTVVLSFKQFISDYSGGYTIGVATTSDGGTTWHAVWAATPDGDIGPEIKDIIIDNSDLTSNFQFCFFFSGNSYNINNWNIDDVILYAPDNLDLAVSAINNKHYILPGDQTISVDLKNIGLTNITSFDISYQIDDNTPITESITGVNLALTAPYSYEFSETWTATTGDYNIKVWISNINGGTDDSPDNDTIANFDFHVASQSTQRTVLYEEFTSSTCSPCATFNSQYFTTAFLNNNEGKFTLIKYQMNWPSSGDPYYTEEGGTRRYYYGISGVPTLMIDASAGTHFNTTDLQTDLDNHYVNPAIFDINALFYVWGDSIRVVAGITPYVNANDFTVQIAVVEKTTTGNTGNNGETEFHNVMMKMLPDANGTKIDFTDGTKQTLDFSYDMSSTNVEEMNDLAVVVFVQNDITHEVFQSAFAITPHINFFPEDQQTNFAVDSNIIINFNVPIRFVDDSEITNDDISSFVSISDSSKADIPFSATIDADKKVITITPDSNLPYAAEITVTFTGTSVEDTNDVAFSDTTITFTTENGAGLIANQEYLRVYPNPATEYVNVKCNIGSEIMIIDFSGKLLQQTVSTAAITSLNVQNLSSGIYFIKIKNNSGIKQKKLIIR